MKTGYGSSTGNTDKGPAHTSADFQTFSKTLLISLTMKIPYNPHGQGIVECAQRTLKIKLLKQKGEALPTKESHLIVHLHLQ